MDTDTILLISDCFEGGLSAVGWIVLSIYGYFFLDDFLPHGEKSNVIPYLRTLILIMAGVFFAQGAFAALMATGNESLGTTLTGFQQPMFVDGLRVRDYRWISIIFTSVLISIAISGYNAVAPSETIGFALTVLVWGLSGFHILRSPSLATMLFLSIVGFVVVLAGAVTMFFLSRVKTYVISWRTLIYVFYFGWMLTMWCILIISCPVVQGFGDIAPQFIYWCTSLLAFTVIALVIRLTMASRKAKYGNQAALTGTGMVSNAFAKQVASINAQAIKTQLPSYAQSSNGNRASYMVNYK